MRSNALLVLLLAGSSLAACGSDSSGPEEKPQRIVTVPSGWLGIGDNPSAYAVGLDTASRHGGTASAYTTTTLSSPTGFMGMGQYIRADAYRGQRIRLSGWVRHTGIKGDGAALWMRVDGPKVVQAFDNMGTNSRRLMGTSEWHQVSLVLDVSSSAVGIGLGFFLVGAGDFQVDDLVLETVPTSVPTTAVIVGSPMPLGDSTYVANWYGAKPTAPANLNFETR